ncbi:MAG: enoyl-CoA hydratase-related protein [Deltaproteobacteria bacterium]|nr:enoyl-CoA hydratase-related protein [Sandaracinaceae bacterium]MCX7807344.1 enoyl-CoA hydratase-related protein [Deltaproteobacteria bacterium]
MEAPAYSTLLTEREGSILRITLNRPERKNALNPRMVNELIWALDEAKADRSVRVIVITGAKGVFCAGADLRNDPVEGEALPPKGDFADLLLRFPSLGKPTIARIHGPALGGGLGLVASCDFAIASETSTFGTPEIQRGLFPMMIMAVLRRVVSKRRLMELMLTGTTISAKEAAQIDLINRAVPEDELDKEVDSLAHQLAEQSPTAMRMGLEAWHFQADRDLETSLPELRKRFLALLGTEDAQEGIRAFLEKRKPIWKGD